MTAVKGKLLQAEAQLRALDQETDVGTHDKGGARLREGGVALQQVAEEILRTKDPEVTEMDRLWARYLRLRGLGYEGEGCLAQAFGVMKAMAKGFPAVFIELSRDLVRLDPTKFDDLREAHGIKVQAMVSLGRFYHRLPKPMQNLPQAKRWLETAMEESKHPPIDPEHPVEPVLPKLYLVEVLRTENTDETKQQELLARVKELTAKPLSRFEQHLTDVIARALTRLS